MAASLADGPEVDTTDRVPHDVGAAGRPGGRLLRRALARVRRSSAAAGERSGAPVPDRVSRLLDALPEAAYVFDPVLGPGGRPVDLLVRVVNRAAEAAEGRSAASLSGRRVVEAYPTVARAGLMPVYLDVLRTGEPWSGLLPGEDGTRVFDVTAQCWDGGLLVTCVDCRDRLAGQRDLEASQALLDRTFQASPVGLALVGLDGRWLRVNDELCAIVARTREDLLAGAWREITHPDDLERSSAELGRLLRGELAVLEFDKRYVRPDGTAVPVALRSAVVRAADGSPLHLVTSFIDRTDQLARESEVMGLLADLARARDALADREAFTGALLDSLAEGIVGVDAEGTVRVLNRTLIDWHDPDRRPSEGMSFAAYAACSRRTELDGSVLQRGATALERALVDHEPHDKEWVLRGAGTSRRLFTTARPVLDADGEVVGALAVMRDVTHERALEAAEAAARKDLAVTARRLQATFAQGPVGMFVLDADDRVVEANDAFARFLGRPLREVVGGLGSLQLAEEHQEPFRASSRRVLEDPARTERQELRFARGDGTQVWAAVRQVAVETGDGTPLVLVHAEDVTSRKAAQEQLLRQATFDGLTGLVNRRVFLERLAAALQRSEQSEQSDQSVAVLFCDLDGFKHINDTFGHALGDLLLEQVAGRLRGVLRDSDTAGRFGGDEFLVLAEHLPTGPACATELAGRIIAELARPYVVDGQPLTVSASVGVALAGPRDAPEQVLRASDSAMYEAKQHGKNRWELYDDGLREVLDRRAVAEQALRAALDRCDGVAVHYQPVVDMGDGSLRGVEALARLTLPDGSLLMPGDFIGAAEDTGLITALGTRVLERACADVATWQREHGRRLVLAVNVSARQAARADLVSTVLGVLAATGLPAGDLCLELTETVLLQADRATVGHLVRLREAGVAISLDDFGTGYASLRYLATLPISGVKIDRSFTAGLGEDPAAEAIVAAVIGLAEDLHLECVVEGVETTAQRDLLDGHRGLLAQGYLFARPAADLPDPQRPRIPRQPGRRVPAA